jgi:ABC-type uncharacterized transport system substrate-binding protein
MLGKYAKGKKVGFLTTGNETGKKEGAAIKEKFKLEMTEFYVQTVDEWKASFIDAQTKVDMLLIYNNDGLKDWDVEAMKAFVDQNTKIPTGANMDYMAVYALAGFTKSAEEQGSYAAKTALDIIGGKKVSDIPVVPNTKAKVFVNTRVGKALGVTFDLDIMDQAEVIK